MSTIEIRRIHVWEEYVQCEEVQRLAWQMAEDLEVVPAHLLVTADKNGGLVLGAFDGAQMIGFVFGFLGSERAGTTEIIKHCSHQLGVIPEYRAHGVGERLKQKQREYLIEQGLELATWTYDPLQAVNARLNLSRLGAIARRYIRDAYGELTDALNAGVATDRFEAEWWLNSRRVREQIGGLSLSPREASAQELYTVRFDERGLPRIEAEADLSGERCRVEIPLDFNALKAADLPLARTWRHRTRATFERAFERGYIAVDVERWNDAAGNRRTAYILERGADVS